MTGEYGRPRPRSRKRRFALVAAVLSAAALALLTLVASPAYAYTQSDRNEQFRYAYETMNLTYTQFIARKTDFQRAGCRNDDKKFTHQGSHTPGCTKPSPYDAFNWTDDGCSGREQFGIFGKVVSNAYRDLFNQPCQLHDFGYRNLGEGLALDRTENTRYWVDNRFRTEMNRLCDGRYSSWFLYREKADCKSVAEIVYKVVRRASNWNGPPKVTPAPVDPGPAPSPAPAPGTSPGPGSSPVVPAFSVMNTSETLPDGVWFRDNPNFSGPRLNGYGVYMGDRVQLQCYGWGESIGRYNNRLWYRAANLTRPHAPGRANVGWLNAHYVDDGKVANVWADGVPPC